jgi:hypothetical protein
VAVLEVPAEEVSDDELAPQLQLVQVEVVVALVEDPGVAHQELAAHGGRLRLGLVLARRRDELVPPPGIARPGQPLRQRLGVRQAHHRPPRRRRPRLPRRRDLRAGPHRCGPDAARHELALADGHHLELHAAGPGQGVADPHAVRAAEPDVDHVATHITHRAGWRRCK